MSDNTQERCWAEIDVSAFRHNARVAHEKIGAGCELLAVIKANGYGHGLAAVARALAEDAQLFGVANLAEAIDARTEVRHPVVILGPALPEERSEIVRRGFIASISSFEEAREFRCDAKNSVAWLNCKIDTGMGRMGMAADRAVETVRDIAALGHVRLHSISTHLPSADEEEAFTREQLRDFAALAGRIRAAVPGPYLVHALPSAGALRYSEHAFDIVRAGLMLYGVSPLPEEQALLRPVMTWKSRIVLVRDVPEGTSVSYGRTFKTRRRTRLATLSVGYADGLPRAVSNNGAMVLVHGYRCPIVGRVTMDLTNVDVTDVPDEVVSGDEVVLIGRQRGETILATEVADRAGTIPWEIFTGIGSRVTRVYL